MSDKSHIIKFEIPIYRGLDAPIWDFKESLDGLVNAFEEVLKEAHAKKELKSITLTESQFDEMFRNYPASDVWAVRQRLFGEKV